MAGAHLDCVTAGPGINDNGSGSAAVLETALAVSRAGYQPTKHLRFAWWGAEELGLRRLAVLRQQPARHRAREDHRLPELRHDRLAEPRLLRLRRRPGDREDLQGLLRRSRRPDRDRDRGRRPLRPRPVQERRASRSAASSPAPSRTRPRRRSPKWGGTAGQAFDRCYHSSCDTTSNINDTALDRNSDAIAYAVWTLSGRRTETELQVVHARGRPVGGERPAGPGRVRGGAG